MKLQILAVLLVLSTDCLLGQTEAVSPIYTFNIRKKIEPPILNLVPGSVQFLDGDDNGALDANESCVIRFDVSNNGVGDGLGLRALNSLTGATAGITISEALDLPVATLGKTTTFEIPIVANRRTQDGALEVSIVVDEPNGFGLDPIAVSLETRAFRAPKVEVVDFKLRGEGTLKRKSPFAIEVLLQNVGQGEASEVLAQFSLPDGVFLLGGDETFEVARLAPGESRSLVYDCVINNNYDDETVPIGLNITESFGTYGSSWTHAFSFNDVMTSDRLVVEAAEKKSVDIQVGSLTSSVDKNIPDWGRESAHRYAVVIGNEDYASRSASLNPEVNVDFAVNDAQIMARYLTGAFGVPQENIHLLTDATAGEMRREVNWLKNIIRAESGKAEIYFYYSGHGLPHGTDNTPYLIPVDVDGQQPQLGVSLPDLYQELTEFPLARVHVLLDACFSGGARNEELVAMKGIRVVPKADAIPDGLLVWASSSGNQASGVYREEMHGHFTYQLLNALQSSDADALLGDLFGQIRRAVDLTTARQGFQQQPQALVSPADAGSWQQWPVLP